MSSDKLTITLRNQLDGRDSNPSDETELVQNVVVKLNAICKTATLDFAMSVGRLIIESFYSGCPNAWRARGAKTTSFRKLANHPDLPMSPSALYRSVAIYELCSRLGAERWKYVSTTHMRLVLPLSPAEQAKLLHAAEAGRWPVRKLRTEIARPHGDSPAIHHCEEAKRARPSLRRTVRTLRGCLDASDSLVGGNEPELEISPESTRSIREVLQRVRHACFLVENRLKTSHAVSEAEGEFAGNGPAQPA